MSDYLVQKEDVDDLPRLLHVKEQMGQGKYLKRLMLAWETMIVFREPLLLSQGVRYKFFYDAKTLEQMNLTMADNPGLVIKELKVNEDYAVVDPYQDIPEWKDK